MEGNSIKRRKIYHWEKVSVLLVIFDIITICVSYGAALWLRFDLHYSQIPAQYLQTFIRFIPEYTVITVIIYSFLHLYRSIWRFASFTELSRILGAMPICCGVQVAGTVLFFNRMPVSYYVLGILLQFLLTGGVRFSYRFLRLLKNNQKKTAQRDSKVNTMIIGAGSAGRTIIREIFTAEELNKRVCCVIDDNGNKKGRYIEGIPVVGNRFDIMASVEKYGIEEIIFAIPTATAIQKRDILNICKETGCKLQSTPGIYQLIDGEVSISQLKEVSVEELLGRDPIRVDLKEIMDYVSGKTVLVTGGGGSIGSELCRQIAVNKPKELIIFDIYENNAYSIQQELKFKHPELNLTVLIGSVRDRGRIEQIFSQHRPDIVYHAAAHKHVPLMEDSPNEAIKNNVLGTYQTALAADKYGTKRFVLISTDKAVNPTNIMGASKRLCEMIIQAVNRKSQTEFVAVRFGNVLGSNGSVIPLFKKQIANGGPVTVTHPDIIRYFMTIPEAVSLVLQAGAYAKGGEIFILDMGDPVKIDDLARNLIKLSGHTPDVDIPIVYTGLRPGEKLYEELLMSEEGLQDTENKLIHIGKPIEMDEDRILKSIAGLKNFCYENPDNIRSVVADLVPTYQYRKQDRGGMGESGGKQVLTENSQGAGKTETAGDQTQDSRKIAAASV